MYMFIAYVFSCIRVFLPSENPRQGSSVKIGPLLFTSAILDVMLTRHSQHRKRSPMDVHVTTKCFEGIILNAF